jgi:hypothetical protein
MSEPEKGHHAMARRRGLSLCGVFGRSRRGGRLGNGRSRTGEDGQEKRRERAGFGGVFGSHVGTIHSMRMMRALCLMIPLAIACGGIPL